MLNLKRRIKGISTRWGLICMLVLIFSGLSIAQESDTELECVMMGILPSATGSLPDGIFTNTLMTDSKSIRYGNQSNGWGMAWYQDFGSTPLFDRNAEKPINDGAYTDACSGVTVPAGEYARMAAHLNTIKPKILLTHWRTGSSGCSGYVADMHPFYREYDGKTWSFTQNGGQTKERTRRLIIDGNPDPVNNDWMNDLPNSSGVLGCYPQEVCKYHNTHVVGDITYMVDSELYFLLIMKEIKEAHSAGDTTLHGIVNGIQRILNAGETGGINFILSDGYSMWGFQKGTGYYLNYRYDPTYHFTHIATMALTGKDINGNSTGFDNSGWVAMKDYQIVVAEQGAAPVLYDIRNLIPGNLDGNTYVDEKDEAKVLQAMGSCQGNPNYNQQADFDGDGCVTENDLDLWNNYYADFIDTILCDDHSDYATRCCRNFQYCGGTYLTLETAGTNGTIDSGGDIDYFKFSAIQSKVYTIKVVSTPSPSTTTYLYLYNSSQTQLASSTSKQITWTCPSSGLYYIKVYYSSLASSGQYTLTLSVPNVTTVQIDIKPGSYPNCVTNDGQGVIPVAILSNPASGFDATQVNPSTITLNGLPVNAVNGIPQTQITDVNQDGINDLVVQIQNQPYAFKQDTSKAELIGQKYDGSLIRGIDSICIVPSIIACAPNKTLTANTSCQAAIPDLTSEVVTFENVGVVSITQSPAAGTAVGLGVTPVTITVANAAGNISICSATITVVDATPPTITAPLDVTAYTGIDATTCGVVVSDETLGSAIAFDNCSGLIVNHSGVPASNFFPVGTTTITYMATDGAGNTATGTQTVTVVDNTPPTIGAALANPSVLWPPNHKLVDITVNYNAVDNCDPNPKCKIPSVSSNEPENGLGDGDTAPDWQITGDLTLNLRAERSGTGSGRLYTINVECIDSVANSSKRTVGVTVPHDRGNK